MNDPNQNAKTEIYWEFWWCQRWYDEKRRLNHLIRFTRLSRMGDWKKSTQTFNLSPLSSSTLSENKNSRIAPSCAVIFSPVTRSCVAIQLGKITDYAVVDHFEGVRLSRFSFSFLTGFWMVFKMSRKVCWILRSVAAMFVDFRRIFADEIFEMHQLFLKFCEWN